MRKRHIHKLTLVIVMVLGGLTAAAAQDTSSAKSQKKLIDSNHVISKSWNKVAFQMKKFNNVVVTYVKTLKKAEPADSNLTKDVETYSDSVNAALSHDGSRDSSTLKRLQIHFDSLVQASIRLVKNVEKDSSLKNNKALKQLGKSMNALRIKVQEYQASINANLQKNSAKKEEEHNQPKSAKP